MLVKIKYHAPRKATVLASLLPCPPLSESESQIESTTGQPQSDCRVHRRKLSYHVSKSIPVATCRSWPVSCVIWASNLPMNHDEQNSTPFTLSLARPRMILGSQNGPPQARKNDNSLSSDSWIFDLGGVPIHGSPTSLYCLSPAPLVLART